MLFRLVVVVMMMVFVLIVDGSVTESSSYMRGSREFGDVVSLLERLELRRVGHGGGRGAEKRRRSETKKGGGMGGWY